VLAWGTDPNGIWVAVEPNEGTPLSTLLSRGPLTPPAAAALGAAVLSGVAALPRGRYRHGRLRATAIRVTGNGAVRLAGTPRPRCAARRRRATSAPTSGHPAWRFAPRRSRPAGAPRPAERPPAWFVTMRSWLAAPWVPRRTALKARCARWPPPSRPGSRVAAQAELATRASGREMPDATAFVPKEAVAPGPPPPAPAPPPLPPAPFVPPVPREETLSGRRSPMTPRHDRCRPIRHPGSDLHPGAHPAGPSAPAPPPAELALYRPVGSPAEEPGAVRSATCPGCSDAGRPDAHDHHRPRRRARHSRRPHRHTPRLERGPRSNPSRQGPP